MLDWLWRKVNTPMYVVIDISDRFIITSVILQNQKDSYKILHRDCIECMGLYGNSSLQIKMLYQNIDLAIKKVESTLNFKIKNIILSIPQLLRHIISKLVDLNVNYLPSNIISLLSLYMFFNFACSINI